MIKCASAACVAVSVLLSLAGPAWAGLVVNDRINTLSQVVVGLSDHGALNVTKGAGGLADYNDSLIQPQIAWQEPGGAENGGTWSALTNTDLTVNGSNLVSVDTHHQTTATENGPNPGSPSIIINNNFLILFTPNTDTDVRLVGRVTTTGTGDTTAFVRLRWGGGTPFWTLITPINPDGSFDVTRTLRAGRQYELEVKSFADIHAGKTGTADSWLNFSIVPEPASLALLAVGALSLRRRR